MSLWATSPRPSGTIPGFTGVLPETTPWSESHFQKVWTGGGGLVSNDRRQVREKGGLLEWMIGGFFRVLIGKKKTEEEDDTRVKRVAILSLKFQPYHNATAALIYSFWMWIAFCFPKTFAFVHFLPIEKGKKKRISLCSLFIELLRKKSGKALKFLIF